MGRELSVGRGGDLIDTRPCQAPPDQGLSLNGLTELSVLSWFYFPQKIPKPFWHGTPKSMMPDICFLGGSQDAIGPGSVVAAKAPD